MDPVRISELLKIRFGENVMVSHLEAMPWFRDAKTQQTWRGQLLNTFKRRMIDAGQRGVTENVIDETESFIAQLENFGPTQTLFSFSAASETKAYAGWAIDEVIVHCIPCEK